MADKPILFSGPMVRALLEGRKTQTRRTLKPLPRRTIFFDPKTSSRDQYQEPRYAVGDRLYVREAWHAARSLDTTRPRDIPRDADIEHAATARNYAEIGLKGKLRPGMSLPRWASRITLIVTDVRIQRLQDINREDARAEGMPADHNFEYYEPPPPQVDSWQGYERASFFLVWSEINGKRPGCAVKDNPWVAAYTFTVHKQNIDALPTSAAA